MSTETQLAEQPAPQQSALSIMAARFNVPPMKLLETLKATVFKGATDNELLALVVVSNEYGLNPLTKEIYAFPAKGGGIVPIVSIDGWINRMNSNAQFDGIEFEDSFGEDGKPYSCTAKIHRKDRSHPVVVTEYYSECHRNTDPWNKCPSRMLRHRALMQGVRVAFGFGGVYDEDDAEIIAAARNLPASRESAPMPDALKVKVIEASESTSPFADILCSNIKATEFSYTDFYNATGFAPEDISEEEAQRQLDGWALTLETMESAKKKGGKAK